MTTTAFATLGDGCRLAYELSGAEDAPVLVLANSLGTNLTMWDDQVESFGSFRRVLRYDMRGHGASHVPAGAYGLDRLGRDLVELLDDLNVKQVDVCGLSLGGMVGQWLAWRQPSRIRRLVLANTSAFMGPPATWQARIDAVTENGMAAVVDAVIERWFTPAARAVGLRAVEDARAMLMQAPAAGYVGCCAAIRDMDLRPTARLIEVPTLVIGGSLDPATPPEHADALAEAIPNSELSMLTAAHLSNMEAPNAFNRRVRDFLDDG